MCHVFSFDKTDRNVNEYATIFGQRDISIDEGDRRLCPIAFPGRSRLFAYRQSEKVCFVPFIVEANCKTFLFYLFRFRFLGGGGGTIWIWWHFTTTTIQLPRVLPAQLGSPASVWWLPLFFFLKGTIRNGYKGMRKQASDLHFPTQTLGREWVHGNAVVASTHHNHHLIITFSSSSFFSDEYFSQILDSQFISYVIFCIVFLGSSRMIPDWERDDGIDVTSSRQERRRISGSPSF